MVMLGQIFAILACIFICFWVFVAIATTTGLGWTLIWGSFLGIYLGANLLCGTFAIMDLLK